MAIDIPSSAQTRSVILFWRITAELISIWMTYVIYLELVPFDIESNSTRAAIVR